MAVGGNTACARLVNGQARCWGGEPGDGSPGSSLVPVVVQNPAGTGPLTGVAQLDVGGAHACATLISTRVVCWGFNLLGQLGSDGYDRHRRPTLVLTRRGPLADVVAVSAGFYFTCAVVGSGEARCWGQNDDGQLGDGRPTRRRHFPQAVRAVTGPGVLTGVREIAAGYNHACARVTGGQVRCWGRDGLGSLGNDETAGYSARPVVVERADGRPFSGTTRLATGAFLSCAVVGGGEVRCWGGDQVGQLGDGEGPAPTAPHPVPVLSPRGAVDPTVPGRLTRVTRSRRRRSRGLQPAGRRSSALLGPQLGGPGRQRWPRGRGPPPRRGPAGAGLTDLRRRAGRSGSGTGARPRR